MFTLLRDGFGEKQVKWWNGFAQDCIVQELVCVPGFINYRLCELGQDSSSLSVNWEEWLILTATFVKMYVKVAY